MPIAPTAETVNGFSPEDALAHLENQNHHIELQNKKYVNIDSIQKQLCLRRKCVVKRPSLLRERHDEQQR